MHGPLNVKKCGRYCIRLLIFVKGFQILSGAAPDVRYGGAY